MIVDSSALVAILFGEAERDEFVSAILAAPETKMSAASYVECGAVVDRRDDPVLSRRYDELLTTLDIEVVEVSPREARVARDAYRDFGRGSGHRASLNFGDCFSYALAVLRQEALLFKGDDFTHTDVRRVTE